MRQRHYNRQITNHTERLVPPPPDPPAALIDESKSLRAEFVIRVTGKVAKRPAGMANPRHATGEIELRVTGFQLLNESAAPPVSPSRPGSRQDRVPGARGQDLPNEELRLEYRYLDLRRPEMQQTLLLRDRMIPSMREYFGGVGLHHRRDPRP